MKRSEKIESIDDPYDHGWKYNQEYLLLCPFELGCGKDDLDDETFLYNRDKNQIIKSEGCRGITCEQCWDKEAD